MNPVKARFFKSSTDKEGEVLRIVPGELVVVGEEGSKYVGEVATRAGKSLGRFFIKELIKDISINEVIKKYEWLKRRDLPVVPDIWFSRKANILVMTEMSEDGNKILIDRHFPLTSYGIKPEQISNWSKLTSVVENIARTAYEDGKGMEIDNDNYMLILEKKGVGYTGTIVLVDIVYGANFLGGLSPDLKKAATLESNVSSARKFISEIATGTRPCGKLK